MPLIDKIQNKSAVIGVVGLGYVGLPLAVAFAEAGFRVIGIDADQRKIDALCKRESYIADVDGSRVALVTNQGKFQAVLPEQVAKLDVAVICVPTPITENKKPDLSYITKAVNQIGGRLSGIDSMVVLESSTYPGTTRGIVLPILGGAAKYVAYSPERVDPGSKVFGIKNTPKLVGGIDSGSTQMACLLYSKIIDKIIPVSSPEVAETAKLYENVFRNVNIALVNEMALICEKIGISVWEVIDAAATKPFGFMPFYPGVGVGGHCIGTDDYYLIDKSIACGYYPRLDKVALDINGKTPQRVAYRIRQIVPFPVRKAKILVLGIAFKRDVNDVRESPSVELLEILQSWGADVYYNDPYVHRITNHKTYDETSVELTDELLGSADCVVIATDHSCYDWQYIVSKSKLVFDTRNATKGIASSKIYRLGEKRG